MSTINSLRTSMSACGIKMPGVVPPGHWVAFTHETKDTQRLQVYRLTIRIVYHD
jgi:predicted small lipoprotein YifL